MKRRERRFWALAQNATPWAFANRKALRSTWPCLCDLFIGYRKTRRRSVLQVAGLCIIENLENNCVQNTPGLFISLAEIYWISRSMPASLLFLRIDSNDLYFGRRFILTNTWIVSTLIVLWEYSFDECANHGQDMKDKKLGTKPSTFATWCCTHD